MVTHSPLVKSAYLGSEEESRRQKDEDSAEQAHFWLILLRSCGGTRT